MRIKKKPNKLEIPDIQGYIIVRFDENGEEFHMEEDLFQAAADGDHEKIIQLLSSDVSVDAEEFNKLLLKATTNHFTHYERFADKIRKKCIITVDTSFAFLKNYVTPLQIAAANGNEKCVQTLLDHGANVDAADSENMTALHFAAEMGHHLCLKALLCARADTSVPSNRPGYEGMTALHLATFHNHVNCVKGLILNGTDYNAVDEFGRTSLHIATSIADDECVFAHLDKTALRGVILSLPCLNDSDTPLHIAVRRGKAVWVKKLLSFGSDVNHINKAGFSPLHLALTECPMEKRLEIAKILLLEGRAINASCRNRKFLTPLHCMLEAERRLRLKENIEFCVRPQEYAEHYLNLAKLLIDCGARVLILDRDGFSLLEKELKNPDSNPEILRYIVGAMPRMPSLISEWSCIDFQKANYYSHPGPEPRNLNVAGILLNKERISFDQLEIVLTWEDGYLCFRMNKAAVEFLEIKSEPFIDTWTHMMRYAADQSLIKHVYEVLDSLVDEEYRKEEKKAADKVRKALKDVTDFYHDLHFFQDASKEKFIAELCDDLEPFLHKVNLLQRREAILSVVSSPLAAYALEKLFGDSAPFIDLKNPLKSPEFRPMSLADAKLLENKKLLILHAGVILEQFMNVGENYLSTKEKERVSGLFQACKQYFNYDHDKRKNKAFSSLFILRNQLWYEVLGSKSGTLQHLCRCAIRKHLGFSKLKLIQDLPIPNFLQSYLLLTDMKKWN